jgi:2-methylcitrate dehydratase
MMKTIAERMSEWGVGLRFEDLPPAVVHEVKRRVLDSLGCAFGAWHEEPCEIARRVGLRLSAESGATLLGTKHRAPADWATFANGCLVRYLDYNDTYLSLEPAHPSDNIPPALAAAEMSGAGGRQLITAIAIAYEVQCRLCDAVSIRAKGWDHVTYGTFSSAAAAAKVMGLTVEQTRHAIGIAGVASANLRQSRVGELSHWKGCAFAGAARQGVFSAMLAAEGMTGPAPIFEGANGFEKLVSGPLPLKGPFAADGKLRGLDDPMILKTSIKCWPAEYHSQSAIEAALAIRGEIGDWTQIAQVTIESHDASVDIIGTGPERWRPGSRETADHSLPYITGVALVDGEVTAKQFAPERYTEPKLLEFLTRVKVARHAELSAEYPRRVGNIVTVTTKNGQTVKKRVDSALGHDKNPMSDHQVEGKYHSQADALIGKSQADALAAWVWTLDEHKSVGELAGLAEVK